MTTTHRARVDEDTTPSRVLPRVAAALLTPLAAAALVLAPSPALAHDTLIESTPENGETLDAVPEEVVLTFSNSPMEGGSGSAIIVTGPDGETTYEEGDLTFDGTDVSVGLSPLDEAGEYTIGFRVVSSDGHPIQESLTFSVTEEAVAEAAPEPEPEESDPAEESADEPAEEAPEESSVEEADEGGVSPVALIVLAAVALGGIAAVVLVIVRMRSSSGSGEGTDQK